MKALTRRHALPVVLAGLPLIGLVMSVANAQPLAAGPTIAGLGGASAALARDPHALANPASIAGSTAFEVAFGASRSFGLKELDHFSTAITVRMRPFVSAAVIEAYGYEDYRQVTAHIAVANTATSQPELGVRVTARRLRISGYGSRMYFAASAGLKFAVTPTVDAGLTVENGIRTGDSDLMLRMVFGVRILLTGHLILYADLDREGGLAPGVHAGLQKTILGRLALRSGFSTAPSSFAFGIGVWHRGVEASIASQRHQPLGWSRSVGITLGG